MSVDDIKWAIPLQIPGKSPEGLEIAQSYSPSDPRNARVVIDACLPWNRRDTFPQTVRPSAELDARILAKFKDVLPKGH